MQRSAGTVDEAGWGEDNIISLNLPLIALDGSLVILLTLQGRKHQ